MLTPHTGLFKRKYNQSFSVLVFHALWLLPLHLEEEEEWKRAKWRRRRKKGGGGRMKEEEEMLLEAEEPQGTAQQLTESGTGS